MSGVNGGHQDVDIDLRQVIAAVWERKAKIIAVTIAAGALALVGASLIKPSYKAETRLLIESRSPNLSGGEGAGSANDPVLDTLNITSQAQLLQSTDLIKRVARDLKLSDRPEFDPAGQSALPDLLVMVGLKQDPMALDPEDRVIQTFREKLSVYPVEGSRVIAVEFASHDPKLAADVPNRMAEAYLQIQSGSKVDTHAEIARWLEPEIANLTTRVNDAEKKVADYRSSNGLFQTSEANNFSSKQLNDISTELARVRADLANAEARSENVRAGLKAGRASDTLADVAGSQVIQRLKETQTNLQAQINDLSTSLLDNHPRLRGLRAQLSGINQQIERETQKILASLDNEREIARLRERQLTQQMNGLKADSAKAGEEEVGLRALEREASAQRQLLETYLVRYREATSRRDANSSPADARIVSSAVEPSEPFFPKVIPIVIVATLATLIVSCLVVIIAELFSGRALRPLNRRREDDFVMTPQPVATPAVTPSPVEPEPAPAGAIVATTPAAAPIAPNVVTDQPKREHGLFAAAKEMLAASRKDAAAAKGAELDQKQEAAAAAEPWAEDIAAKAPLAETEEESFTIASVARYLQRRAVPIGLVVSPGGDAGSTATVMLAREISERGRTVVLIDMTGSACPTRLMAQDDKLAGITDLLCGEVAFGEAIHPDRLSDAHIVPFGAADPVRAMKGVDRLSMVVDALADAYDLVLIECGPAEATMLQRLTRNDKAEVILSVPDFNDEDVAKIVHEFQGQGFRNLLVMSDTDDRSSPRNAGRRVA
jgi:exopolysaccharide transport family protein